MRSPAAAAMRWAAASVTPDAAVSVRPAWSTSPTSVSRSVESSTSSCSGTVPATSDVRPPCTVTGAPASRQARNTAATSPALPGRTSAAAVPR